MRKDIFENVKEKIVSNGALAVISDLNDLTREQYLDVVKIEVEKMLENRFIEIELKLSAIEVPVEEGL